MVFEPPRRRSSPGVVVRLLCITAWAVIGGAQAGAQASKASLSVLKTRPELTNYEQTSRYDDVVAFVTAVADASDRIHRTSFGYSFEGRPLPLLVVGSVRDARPESVKAASDRTRVLVVGNEAGGEVDGKEATLVLLRALASGEHAAWDQRLVLLVAPIFNADGNERISLTNRPRTNGPVGGVGSNNNAQNKNLNRDFTKLETPEVRSMVQVLRAYDPHVVIDMRTTNGTRHGYHVGYSPPLNPSTAPGIDDLLRKEWFPSVSAALKKKQGWDTYYYGNVPAGPAASKQPRGWYTFDHRPRYSTNYVGLRNRFAVLTTVYSYLPFDQRIVAGRRFIEEMVDYAAANGERIRRVSNEADAKSVVGQTLGLQAVLEKTSDGVEIVLGDVEEAPHPYTGLTMFKRTNVRKPERMPEWGAFRATGSERAPQAYYVPPALAGVIDRLEAHGVQTTTLPREQTLSVERFRIDSMSVAAQASEGHNERTVAGAYERADVVLPAGTRVVRVDQPLGRLAFYLLEPRSDDGVLTWNLVDDALKDAKVYPIVRNP
ncbi:MAG: M14 family zinc carboxypeptidase [Vicinamibacterales bacterium]